MDVLKLSLARSIIGTDHPDGTPRKRSLVCVEQKPLLLVASLLSKLFVSGGTVLDCYTENGLTDKSSLQAPKYLNFVGCEKNSFKAVFSTLNVHIRQELNIDSDIN